ncbi:esterase/lipase family protein [Trujillonella humicola]|uniref:esterase/lipase family protein n=1 Tax=Trujillonella humicola TaxID=3383699 RepID=UPI003905EB52
MARQPSGGPALPLYLSEPGRAVADYGLYLAARPLLQALPHGDGHPVLVLPGLLADDASTRTLRATLRRLDYRVHGWRLGRNIGPTPTCVGGMRRRLDDLADRYGRPVSLVGWSLGGIFARELTRATPDSVRQVITLGSPFRLTCESQTRAARVFNRFSHLHVDSVSFPLESECTPLPVPATSIYSHADGIVHWQTCLETPGPRAENIAVHASHLGLGHHPAVVYAVADRLAQAEGSWRHFRAPAVLRPVFPRPDVPRPGSPLAATAA